MKISTLAHVIVLPAILSFQLGCKSESKYVDHPFSDSLRALNVQHANSVGGSQASVHTVALCQHAAFGTLGTGVFRVRDLVGVAEETGWPSEPVRGYTYIVATVEEDISGTIGEQEVVFRIDGGPTSGSTFTAPYFDFAVGEKFLAFARAPYDHKYFGNEGFPILPAGAVFKEARPDVWQLYGEQHEHSELREIIKAAYASFLPGEFKAGDCGMVLHPERCPVETMIPIGAITFDQRCTSEEQVEEAERSSRAYSEEQQTPETNQDAFSLEITE